MHYIFLLLLFLSASSLDATNQITLTLSSTGGQKDITLNKKYLPLFKTVNNCYEETQFSTSLPLPSISCEAWQHIEPHLEKLLAVHNAPDKQEQIKRCNGLINVLKIKSEKEIHDCFALAEYLELTPMLKVFSLLAHEQKQVHKIYNAEIQRVLYNNTDKAKQLYDNPFDFTHGFKAHIIHKLFKQKKSSLIHSLMTFPTMITAQEGLYISFDRGKTYAHMSAFGNISTCYPHQIKDETTFIIDTQNHAQILKGKPAIIIDSKTPNPELSDEIYNVLLIASYEYEQNFNNH